MVAQRPFADGIVSLRQQAGWSSCGAELREQLFGVVAAAGQQVRLDKPGRAEVEAAIATVLIDNAIPTAAR